MSPWSRRDLPRSSALAGSATGLLGQDGLFAQPGSNGLTAATKAGHEWFADSPFNLLVDYYPEVPFRPYGSGATPENVLPVLRELQLGCIIIYAKGHSGTTRFPSSLKTEHPMLGRDMPAAFRDYTRQTGTRLFLYYSGMLDGAAGERHPDWRQLNRDGSPMRHFPGFESFIAWGICPLSGYFDEWVAVQLREMLTRYDPDGIWVDGDWSGPCHCPRCEERFRKETGHQGAMPAYNALTPAGEAWMRTDAPSFIELSLREKDGNLLIHVTNGNPGRDISLVGTDDLWVTDIPAVGPYEFQVRCAAAPRAVRQEPGGGSLEHRFKDGRLTVILPRVEIHTCMVVEAWQRPMP